MVFLILVPLLQQKLYASPPINITFEFTVKHVFEPGSKITTTIKDMHNEEIVPGNNDTQNVTISTGHLFAIHDGSPYTLCLFALTQG